MHPRSNKRRGIALVEALISVSMLIVMFAGVVYFSNLYTAKARVLREARVQAWRATDIRCDGGGHGDAVRAAAIPGPFANGVGSQLQVRSRHEMKCNERNDPRTTVSGVLAWSGLGERLGNFGAVIRGALGF